MRQKDMGKERSHQIMTGKAFSRSLREAAKALKSGKEWISGHPLFVMIIYCYNNTLSGKIL
jgi:hypothetical protein